MKSSCVLYLPSGWEEKCVSLVEYWEKLQHRRSMVARLLKVIQVSPSWTNFVFGKFSTLLAYLQPLWRTTKSKGLTKEWTKATWRETWIKEFFVVEIIRLNTWWAWVTLSPHETLTSWHPSTPSSSWQGWPRREGPRRWGRPPWSPGTSSPSPPPPAPSSWCTPWCYWREGLSPSEMRNWGHFIEIFLTSCDCCMLIIVVKSPAILT